MRADESAADGATVFFVLNSVLQPTVERSEPSESGFCPRDMILFPQEWFDELAAIATVRPWSDFFQWFIAHARELSRFFDGKQKRAFKNFTRPQLRDFLLQNGYAIAMPEPEPPPIDPELQFLDAEYDVYSEVFRQYDLFQFDRPGTLVSDYTGRDRFPKMQRLLEFESETKTYHVRETIDASISWPEGEYWDRRREKQGLLDNFSLKNRWICKLEKRFHVESGSRLTTSVSSRA